MLSWKYKLSLLREKTGAAAEITEPLNISFDIKRTTQTSPNQAEFTVCNLAENTRKAFEKMRPIDYYENGSENTASFGMDDYCSVVFSVQREGEGECVIFKGDVVECHSERSGGEWSTEFNCSDGFFAMKYASMNGLYEKDAFAAASFEKECKKWKLDAELNCEPVKNAVPIAINEKFSQTLDWAFPNNWFIDLNTLVVGAPKEKLVYKIDSDWLAETPKREENVLSVSAMFFPQPRLGNIVEVESAEYGNMGQWEIAGITHKGEFPVGDMGTEFTLIPPGARFYE
jgi:hypothetical protein